MSHGSNLLTLNLDSQKAVERMMNRLAADGMQVIRSFDLRTARAAHVECSCPHHGNTECDCQMVILLVYDDLGIPLTLIAHGNGDKTHFALVHPPERVQDRILKSKVLQAIALEGFSSLIRD